MEDGGSLGLNLLEDLKDESVHALLSLFGEEQQWIHDVGLKKVGLWDVLVIGLEFDDLLGEDL